MGSRFVGIVSTSHNLLLDFLPSQSKLHTGYYSRPWLVQLLYLWQEQSG